MRRALETTITAAALILGAAGTAVADPVDVDQVESPYGTSNSCTGTVEVDSTQTVIQRTDGETTPLFQQVIQGTSEDAVVTGTTSSSTTPSGTTRETSTTHVITRGAEEDFHGVSVTSPTGQGAAFKQCTG